MDIKIGNNLIGATHPVYFIADIASNHCGDLEKAKDLVHACAESGVNAVKMQNFTARSLVSEYGFRTISGIKTHQSKWKKSVYDSYDAASIPPEWTPILKELCEKRGLDYMTSPYSLELTEYVAPYVSAFKMGSGDISWHEALKGTCRFNKPVIIATGASTMHEVEMAMKAALSITNQIILMQCNTDYTASIHDTDSDLVKRYKNINLKVLETYSLHWPDVPVGLSDHTHGSTTVLGAVGLFNCSVVEKHFTLDNTQEGQDHSFSMTPQSWMNMVKEVSSLKKAISHKMTFEERYEVTAQAMPFKMYLNAMVGDGIKKVEKNEENTIVVQRRAIRSIRNLTRGTVLKKEYLCMLRPCPNDALPPYKAEELIGHVLNKDIVAGDCIRHSDIDPQIIL